MKLFEICLVLLIIATVVLSHDEYDDPDFYEDYWEEDNHHHYHHPIKIGDYFRYKSLTRYSKILSKIRI